MAEEKRVKEEKSKAEAEKKRLKEFPSLPGAARGQVAVGGRQLAQGNAGAASGEDTRREAERELAKKFRDEAEAATRAAKAVDDLAKAQAAVRDAEKVEAAALAQRQLQEENEMSNNATEEAGADEAGARVTPARPLTKKDKVKLLDQTLTKPDSFPALPKRSQP